MDKMKRIIEAVTVLAIACIISLPLLCFQNEPGRISVVENKTAASKPELSNYEGVFDKAFVTDLEEYLTDNIGFKEQAILSHISVMYRLFDKVAITNFTKGTEGHTFYITDPIMQIYQGLDKITPEETEVLRQRFLGLDQAVTQSGSQLIFMPIPNKEEIYEEYMPDSIRVVTEESMLDQVTADLIANTQLNVVDTKQILLERKADNELLYYRNTDPSHWNHYGMFVGYQQLMQSIQALDPEISYLTREDVIVERYEAHTPFLYLTQYETIVKTFSDLSDYDYVITPKNGWHGIMDNSTPGGISLSGDTTNRFFHYHNENVLNGKSLVVCGDSYIWTFMLPLLSESFSDVYFVAYNCSEHEIQELLACVDPDFVVFEAVSRMLDYGHLNYVVDKLSEAFEIKKQYLEAELVAQMPVRDDDLYAIHFDHVGLEAAHCINLSEITNGDTVYITGWTAEFSNDAVFATGGVYFGIGDTYIPAAVTERPDLGGTLLHAGYSISIPLNLLVNQDSFQVIAKSADGENVFRPLTIQILW